MVLVEVCYDGWRQDTPLINARFKDNSTTIAVRLNPDWKDIGGGWKRRPGSNTIVSDVMFLASLYNGTPESGQTLNACT